MPITWFNDHKGASADVFITAVNGLSESDRNMVATAYTFDRGRALQLRRRFFAWSIMFAVLIPTLIGWALSTPGAHGALGGLAFLLGAFCIPPSVALFSFGRSQGSTIRGVDTFTSKRIGHDVMIYDNGRSHWWMAFVGVLKEHGTWHAMYADMSTSSIDGEWLNGEIASHLASLPDIDDVYAAEEYADELRAAYLARSHATQ